MAKLQSEPRHAAWGLSILHPLPGSDPGVLASGEPWVGMRSAFTVTNPLGVGKTRALSLRRGLLPRQN